MARSALADPHLPSSLARLLETEARLEALLADARERAKALLREAEGEAKERVVALETELANTATLAEDRRSADCAERLAALSREHQVALDALRGIVPERITELARWVSNQVLDRAPAEGSR